MPTGGTGWATTRDQLGRIAALLKKLLQTGGRIAAEAARPRDPHPRLADSFATRSGLPTGVAPSDHAGHEGTPSPTRTRASPPAISASASARYCPKD